LHQQTGNVVAIDPIFDAGVVKGIDIDALAIPEIGIALI